MNRRYILRPADSEVLFLLGRDHSSGMALYWISGKTVYLEVSGLTIILFVHMQTHLVNSCTKRQVIVMEKFNAGYDPEIEKTSSEGAHSKANFEPFHSIVLSAECPTNSVPCSLGAFLFSQLCHLLAFMISCSNTLNKFSRCELPPSSSPINEKWRQH